MAIVVSASGQDYDAPVDWEINLEGGLDFRREYLEVGQDYPAEVLVRGLRQNVPSAYAGLSAMRRIPGLRALYGLRVDGHLGTLALDGADAYAVEHATASGMVAYRFFPLDLQGDCDCPTWGDDPWLKKALFLEVGLGVGYQRYGSTVARAASRTRWGGAYLARAGLSHRLTRSLDLYAAAGVSGILADNNAFYLNDFGVRPVLGLTWRP